jgi:hypothetical protein
MGVRMPSVEMVDCHPVELRSEVRLRLEHEPADHRLQVGIFGAIFGRDNEPELMTIAGPAFQERPSVGTIDIGRIERPPLTFARSAVSLKVAKMRGCGISALAAEAHEPRLDHHTAAPRTRVTVRCAQDPAGRRAASDAAAVEPSRPRMRASDCSAALIECLA